jgi:membrane-bound ClpP family serine protease
VEKLLNSGPFGLITDQDGGKSWSSFIESFTHQGEIEMLADDWSRKLAASKGTYSVALVMVFFILNLLVQFTYKWSGKISFSWMILTLMFQGFWMNLTHLSREVGVVSGVILFCIVATALFKGSLALLGTRAQIIGWILLVVLFISALPIFDYRKISI